MVEVRIRVFVFTRVTWVLNESYSRGGFLWW